MLYGSGSTDLVLNGPREAFADEMMHHTMAYGTLGYPYHFQTPQPVNPYNFIPDKITAGYQATGLGCCDWCSDDRLGGELMGLGDCPGGPTVIVESTPISPWVLIIAAAWAALMLLKK
jgi:hypothetical protein